MTVIAWDGTTLASDSQMTDDCGITFVTKIFELPSGGLFGGAGMAGYVAMVRDWLLDGAKPKTRPDCSNALVIEKRLADGVGGDVQKLALKRAKKGIRKSG